MYPPIMSIPPIIICMSVCTYLCKSSILRVHYLGGGGDHYWGWGLFVEVGRKSRLLGRYGYMLALIRAKVSVGAL